MVEHFVEVLVRATERIPELYFQLPIAGEADGIFRERVYCYELYHQVRLLLDQDATFRYYALSGEIDKQGHPIIRQCAPDLVFHRPGDMDDNIAVIEVKPANGAVEGIKKDLETLVYFVADDVRYQAGLYLVYGGSDADLAKFVVRFEQAGADKLQLLWHRSAGEQAVRIR